MGEANKLKFSPARNSWKDIKKKYEKIGS
jgi:hypothetical protein